MAKVIGFLNAILVLREANTRANCEFDNLAYGNMMVCKDTMSWVSVGKVLLERGAISQEEFDEIEFKREGYTKPRVTELFQEGMRVEVSFND
jgi:hypothetical protein